MYSPARTNRNRRTHRSLGIAPIHFRNAVVIQGVDLQPIIGKFRSYHPRNERCRSRRIVGIFRLIDVISRSASALPMEPDTLVGRRLCYARPRPPTERQRPQAHER